jgi:hypothetical protein
MTPESIAHLAKQNGVAKVDAWNTSDGNKRVPVFTTPPAPVDVRTRELALEGLDYFDKAGDEGDKKYVAAIRALLSGQPAGVDRG